MNLYIWNYMGGVTNSYHDGGGVVIISDKPPREAWDEHFPNYEDKDAGGLGNKYEDPDNHILVADTEEPQLFVFADSGCC